jgi:SLA1 homology domain 1, SHD1
MDECASWFYLDYTTESARDEAMWDEIVNADFSDDERDLSISSPEDNDLVILPAAPQKPSSPPCRTVWEILSERLAKTSFEARFVDAEQRRTNEASIKRRYQWDPTKRRTWTSRCGRHQVVGYFNFYMHTQDIVGLFTEEGFPVQVKLNELSAEDVRFVVTKLGHSLRGKVEVQLSAEQTVKQVEGSKDIKKKNIRMTDTVCERNRATGHE